MVKLFGFGSYFGLADPSPFVLKIDAYLRMAGIPFSSSPSFGNLQRSPKGKLPYIENDGELIADTFFIIQYLEKKYTVSLDDHLSAEEKALAHLVTKSIDENLYWCLVYFRWLSDDTWPTVKQTFFGKLTFPLKYIIPYVARKNIKSACFKHGMGKHSDAEILEIGEASLSSLSALLGNKKYIFGDKPSSLDATLYAFLSQATLATLETPMSHKARQFDNLCDYCKRIHAQYY